MPFRDGIMRLAVADARLFEARTVEMLRDLVKSCADSETRGVIEEIMSEETEHVRRLDELVKRAGPEAAVKPDDEQMQREIPATPDTILPDGPIREKLRDLVEKEEASAMFYGLLAQRTPIRAVRRVFSEIAAMERSHAAKLREHLCRISGPAAPMEKTS